MRRPLAGMGIALVAGVIAAAFGRNGLFFLPAVWVIGIMIILWTDSSFTYVLGLSVFFIVGFCRMMVQEKDPSELDGNIQGTVYKVQEKEQSVFVYVRDKEGRAVLVIVKKEGDENSQYFKGQTYFVAGRHELVKRNLGTGNLALQLILRTSLQCIGERLDLSFKFRIP